MYEDTGAVGPFQSAPDTAQNSAAVTPPAQAAATPDSAAPAKPAPLVLKLKESAWVEIRDVSGKALLSRILKPGDSYIVPATVKGLVLDTGNVGALEFVIDGKPIAALGEKGDVRRGIKLEPEFLKELDARNPRRAKKAAPAATAQ
jgi:cytoskeleton protein RodZ